MPLELGTWYRTGFQRVVVRARAVATRPGEVLLDTEYRFRWVLAEHVTPGSLALINSLPLGTIVPVEMMEHEALRCDLIDARLLGKMTEHKPKERPKLTEKQIAEKHEKWLAHRRKVDKKARQEAAKKRTVFYRGPQKFDKRTGKRILTPPPPEPKEE